MDPGTERTDNERQRMDTRTRDATDTTHRTRFSTSHTRYYRYTATTAIPLLLSLLRYCRLHIRRKVRSTGWLTDCTAPNYTYWTLLDRGKANLQSPISSSSNPQSPSVSGITWVTRYALPVPALPLTTLYHPSLVAQHPRTHSHARTHAQRLKGLPTLPG